MIDYKKTLNLPQTDFPMKANLPQREPECLVYWQQIQLYQQLRQLGENRPLFVLHDGPPYANGRAHLGTALNKILKDIVLKSKTLSGYNTPYIPGWDCHGLPIELNVEKQVGKPGQKLSAKAFRQACRQYARQQVELQSADFQRLGVLGDWQHPYLTMDFTYEANVVRALASIVANGHLHRGQKPVHWCTACGSALAEAEVEYRDKQSPAIDVAFSVIDREKLAALFDVALDAQAVAAFPIWTTTPWTLPANQAVAIHAEFEYALVSATWKNRPYYFIVAAALMDNVMQRYQIADYHIAGIVLGKKLEHLRLQHPFLERVVPVILGEHVTIETGTGNVHTAPAHGLEDYAVGQQYQLPDTNPVDANSRFFADVPWVGGLEVFAANDVLIKQCEQQDVLLHATTIVHSYPHCWRHKTPLIFRATPQWFISMEQQGLRAQALFAVAKVNWLPAWGQARIENMLVSRPDWCISRQRAWGIPIPFFIHKEQHTLHPRTTELMAVVAEHIAEQGIEVWFERPTHEWLNADEAVDYDKITDVLDVWFDSGASHACVLEQNPELRVPADLYLEGSDQHRGWFQTSLLTAVAMREQAPYKTVLTHGYVVDGKGFKMSKSLGNVVAPGDIIKKLGADILRLWAAAVDHRNDMAVSDEILQRSADTYRRIRNTARFLLANLYDFSPAHDCLPANKLLALDRWAIATTQLLQAEIIEAYAQYQFPSIYQKIHNFCTVQMGSFYLDIIKDRQYTSRREGLARRSSQTALYYIIEALVRWLAPILSFTAEEIWRHLPGERVESVFLTTWFTDFPTLDQTVVEEVAYWNSLMMVRDEVNKILEQHRQAGLMGSALDTEVILYAQGKLLADLSRLGDELRFVLITSGARVEGYLQRSEQAQMTLIPDLAVEVVVSTQQKCERCWQRRADVGKHIEHPQLCGRCIDNIIHDGEQRQYA